MIMEKWNMKIGYFLPCQFKENPPKSKNASSTDIFRTIKTSTITRRSESLASAVTAVAGETESRESMCDMSARSCIQIDTHKACKFGDKLDKFSIGEDCEGEVGEDAFG